MEDSLKPAVIDAIAAMLAAAAAQGRDMLYESEVYDILDLLGVHTPTRLVVRQPAELCQRDLDRFGSQRVVLKVMSRAVAHKQKLGGVQVIYKDLEFVRFSIERMRAGFAAQGVQTEAVLLTQFVPYDRDLGNETLLGFRESEAFGPVISFSKGGSDAEHFATHYSPPNLILAPIDRRWAQALLESTRIQLKYLSEGKTDYAAKVIAAGVRFSRLACAFSNFFASGTAHAITEFEVNPLVFDREGRLIALDGLARFAPRRTTPPDSLTAQDASLTPLFNPQGVAVVGVSATDANKTGNLILGNLVRLGRQDVHGVSRGGGQIAFGERTLQLQRSLDEIAGRLDLVVVAVPAEAALTVVEQCAARGVRGIILIPGGFSEVGRNQDAETRILELARQHGMRLLGPNCLGVICSGQPGLNTFFVAEHKFRLSLEGENNVALLSQSGALGITEIANLGPAVSPRVIVSYGNQLDVDPSDLVAYFDRDPRVEVIGLYIEGFRPGGGRKFFDTCTRTRTPIVVYKAGRTAAGRKATESHTASIAGEYEVARAALKQAGVVVADTMTDHAEFIKTFAMLKGFKVTGRRLALVTNAGYEKTSAADNLGELLPAELDARTRAELRAILPAFVNVEPFLDLTPMAGDELFERTMELLLQSDAVDALFVSIVPHSAALHTTDEEMERHSDNLAARIVKTVQRFRKPTAVSITIVPGVDALYGKFGRQMEAGGVPTFLSAQRAMVCLNAFIRHRLLRESRRLSDRLK